MWIESLNNRSDYIDAIQQGKNFIWDPDPQSLPGPVQVPPVQDPRVSGTPLSSQEADLGGVSLHKAAQFIGSITDIMGAVYDSDAGQVVLIGESNKSLPPMEFDDLAVAVRAIYGLGGRVPEDPGISIDWNEENTKKLKKEKYDRLSPMPVRYLGHTGNTRFGQTLFEADRLLKCLILGRDNLSGALLSPPVCWVSQPSFSLFQFQDLLSAGSNDSNVVCSKGGFVGRITRWKLDGIFSSRNRGNDGE